MRTTIIKLYFANFFIGLVFWYGIEKLFMQSIGIDATQIGLVIAAVLGFNLLFDIPSGIIADRWSRKGVLVLSLAAMILCCLILGNANGFVPYLIGYGIFYGLYVVGTSGTSASIVYDTLYEHNKSKLYSKIMGRTYAFYLAGIAVANIASGFLAQMFDFRATYFITILSCLIAIAIILTIKEPTFHKKEQKERMLAQLGSVTRAMMKSKIILVLTIILSTLTVVQVFKNDFGQLYILRYVSEPQFIGLLWAGGALSWATGNLIAHHFKTRLTSLIFITVLPLIAMSFIDTWFSLVLFMLQQVAMGALFNQIETRVQDATPSAVRTSILSVLSSLGRGIAVPTSILIGWMISRYDVVLALRFVSLIAFLTLLYWLWQRLLKRVKDEPVGVE
jgi:MFS family permease